MSTEKPSQFCSFDMVMYRTWHRRGQGLTPRPAGSKQVTVSWPQRSSEIISQIEPLADVKQLHLASSELFIVILAPRFITFLKSTMRLVFIATLMCCNAFEAATSYSVTTIPAVAAVKRNLKPHERRRNVLPTTTLLFVSRDEYLQPHFQTTHLSPRVVDMDRISFCADSNGECSIEEMTILVKGTLLAENCSL
jgi:hypothetical protein